MHLMEKLPVSLAIILPLVILAILTPWSVEIDLWASHAYFSEGRFMSNRFMDCLYYYALVPAWTVSIGGLLVWGLSYYFPKFKIYRTVGMYLTLTLAIGSGVFVHALFKEQWGRPRPKESIEFGGDQPFRPYYEPNFFHKTKSYKSFSCGHCTMGFYFFCVMWLGVYYRKWWLFWSGLGLALGLGFLLSWLRIAQGGHFFTDALVSAIVMWLIALLLYLFLFERKKDEGSNSKTT